MSWRILHPSVCARRLCYCGIVSAEALNRQCSSAAKKRSDTCASTAVADCPPYACSEAGVAGHVSPLIPSACGVGVRPKIQTRRSAAADEQAFHETAITARRQNPEGRSNRGARNNGCEVLVPFRNAFRSLALTSGSPAKACMPKRQRHSTISSFLQSAKLLPREVDKRGEPWQ